MSDSPLFYIDGATEGTTQWRAETFQMVNWGGFHGHHSVALASTATLVSGASGTGKSTLLDAYLALMMPRRAHCTTRCCAARGSPPGAPSR